MAAELLDTSPVFAARLRDCSAAIGAHVDWSVEDVLRRRAGAPALDRVEVVQPALFAVHVALAELWFDSGQQAVTVVGQSQGEIAAACVAGALTLADAARVIVTRSRLFAEELAGRGGIASIALPGGQVRALLAGYGGALELAGLIGPNAVTVAGECRALTDLVERLTGQNVTARIVPASIPSHCAYVEPLRDRLIAQLRGLRPQRARIPFHSTVTGGRVDGRELTADYWYANARRPVVFAPVIRRLFTEGCDVFVECSAHPVLTAAITAITATGRRGSSVVTGTLRRGKGGLEPFRAALAAVSAGQLHPSAA